MSLRIGFDMDGVFADMEGALFRHAETLFGRDAIQNSNPLIDLAADNEGDVAVAGSAEADAAPALQNAQLTRRQQRLLWRHVGAINGFWESLDEIEAGSVARLGTVAAERRWEIIFLTKRPAGAGATPQLQTQRWLQARGFPLPSVFVVQGSRGRIAAALDLDVVVDDRAENCLDVSLDSKARPVLVWRGPANQMPPAAKSLGIGALTSVMECLDILVDLDSRADRPGVLDRVLRRLGLGGTPPEAGRPHPSRR